MASPRLQSDAERVDRVLASLLPAEAEPPEELHQAMRYSCLAPGKRLRPALCLASARAVDGDDEAVLPAACAIEMVHAFSLIHDDLPALDDDDFRRGRPTCHKVFGEAVAILAGDALFALAFETIAQVESTAERRLSALAELASQSGTKGVVGGEVLDILAEGTDSSEAQIRRIHELKTASLMAGSCAIGATLGGGEMRDVELLREFGREIGLAFQIVDDLLDETAASEVIGKPAGSDRRHGKATYPRLYGVEGAREEAERHTRKALESLGMLAGDTSSLRDLADFAVRRDR
ncbi:MAG TPA: polyprenyl synthetase family protein [Fimbriimonadaceae bacterium]|nr:polyprenyl synthetase family protein [Fimbriimonadaceae bacterium]HRJ96142.1 polyprenyl synthetase family protein [Fimbriimonadaceae bacterium]